MRSWEGVVHFPRRVTYHVGAELAPGWRPGIIPVASKGSRTSSAELRCADAPPRVTPEAMKTTTRKEMLTFGSLAYGSRLEKGALAT